MDAEEWRARLGNAVAQQVRRHRLKQGLSVQKLADICAEQYGMPIKRSVLANFEGGRRPALSLAELLVFASALNVPPAMLVFPVGQQETTEVLPERDVDTWAALRWFTGEQPLPPAPGAPAEPSEAWREAANPSALYRRHESLVADWNDRRQRLEGAARRRRDGGPDFESRENEELIELYSATLHRLEVEVLKLRRQMVEQDIVPPPSPFATTSRLPHADTPGEEER